jgi:hypothetical protein
MQIAMFGAGDHFWPMMQNASPAVFCESDRAAARQMRVGSLRRPTVASIDEPLSLQRLAKTGLFNK